MGRRLLAVSAATLLLVSFLVARAATRTLAIYFVDVEGGQSTLVVTPAGESLLVDAGFPGDGTFESKPGDPTNARDAQRILAAVRAAGVSKIDYLLVTHFHGDHDGGVVELSQLIPIRTFVDHGTVPPEAESVAGTLDLFQRYAAVRANSRHIVPKPGDRLGLTAVEATIVSSAGAVLARPLPGAGSKNDACGEVPPAVQEAIENPRSTGVVVRFGRFRFLDVGDLVGAPLRSLVCPDDRIGPVDLYLIAHHGNDDAADRATFAALKPRAAVMNNGARKGGGAQMFAALHGLRGLDVFQLHRSTNPGAENFDAANIANIDEATSHWIKVEASEDGSFEVTNPRTNQSKQYRRQ